MNKISWSRKELELIGDKLAIPTQVDNTISIEACRAAAYNWYNDQFGILVTGPTLDCVTESEHTEFNKYGSDALTVKHIRHNYSNYAQFWDGSERTPIHNITWLIGFLKVGNRMKSLFPELADAISFETIKRVSARDRALLRETVLTLADRTAVKIPTIPYLDLRLTVAERYNRKIRPKSGRRLDAMSPNDVMQERIKKTIVDLFIAESCDPAILQLGTDILDEYTQSLVKGHVYRTALGALADLYPELTETCARRMGSQSERTLQLMDIITGPADLALYSPDLNVVFVRVTREHNDRHRNGLGVGKKQHLYLTAAPESVLVTVRALAVRCILSYYSRYDELAGAAACLPEPMASIQKDTVHMLFLEKVQERYPELTEAIQAQLRLLNRESKNEVAIAS